MEELEDALKDRKDSSPGFDNIPYKILSNCAPSLKLITLENFN